VTRPRPGHADLAGVAKFARTDVRDVLERASARETAARVAAGAIAKQLLARGALVSRATSLPLVKYACQTVRPFRSIARQRSATTRHFGASTPTLKN
jgi:chorismate synthase